MRIVLGAITPPSVYVRTGRSERPESPYWGGDCPPNVPRFEGGTSGNPANRVRSVTVQFSWFWGLEEGWECAAVLVGGEEIAEVGEQAAVL
jgi:hypothetical protein